MSASRQVGMSDLERRWDEISSNLRFTLGPRRYLLIALHSDVLKSDKDFLFWHDRTSCQPGSALFGPTSDYYRATDFTENLICASGTGFITNLHLDTCDVCHALEVCF